MAVAQSSLRTWKVVCTSCGHEFGVREDLLVPAVGNKWEVKCPDTDCVPMIIHRFVFYKPGNPAVEANLDSK